MSWRAPVRCTDAATAPACQGQVLRLGGQTYPSRRHSARGISSTTGLGCQGHRAISSNLGAAVPGAFLKPCLPVRRQGAVKTATTCRFLLEAPPQSDVGRSGTGHGQTKVLNLKARTRPEYTRTEFQSKPGEFYHEHVRQSHFLECQGIHHPAHLPRTGRQHFQSRNQRASRPTATDL